MRVTVQQLGDQDVLCVLLADHAEERGRQVTRVVDDLALMFCLVTAV